MAKLTAKTVEAASAHKETLISDGAGLYLRIRPASGKCSKHWVFVYTNNNQRRKIVLGAYPLHSLAEARAWARDQSRLLDNFIDPAESKRLAKQNAVTKSLTTCGALLDGYVSHLKAQGKQSHSDVANIFTLHVSNSIKALPAASITHKDLIASIRKLVDEGKLRTSAKLRSYLRAAFELALTAEDNPNAQRTMSGFNLTTNPAARIKVPAGSSVVGERTLDKQELSEYVRHIAALPAGDIRDLLRLQLLLAGQRVQQVLMATVEGDSIVIRDSKGKRVAPRKHILPLQGEALAIVKTRGCMFDTSRTQRDAIKASTIVKSISTAMGGKPFRLGDIRRTVETMLASMGFSSDLRAQLLSHGLSGIQNRHYDKHDYLPEKLQMLMAWEATIKYSDSVIQN